MSITKQSKKEALAAIAERLEKIQQLSRECTELAEANDVSFERPELTMDYHKLVDDTSEWYSSDRSCW